TDPLSAASCSPSTPACYGGRSMSTRDSDHFETKAIHAGQEPDPTTGAVMTPVYLTSTYAQSGPGEHKGFEYSRTRNPTRDALQEVSRKRGAISVCDNTFATPFFQRPLEFGFDVVAHSMTKYLNGHSDVVAGALVLRRDDLHEKLAFLQNAVGAVPGPLDSFLVLRGLKTLHVRMERHDQNARLVVEALKRHPKVERVTWPGLPE